VGITYIEGEVRGPTGKHETVEFLLDSGLTYSLLPQTIWKAIEFEPQRQMTFSLADGTKIERSISEAYFVLPQGKAHSPVVLGENGDEALLGAITLEILVLVLNAFDRTLHPTRMLLR